MHPVRPRRRCEGGVTGNGPGPETSCPEGIQKDRPERPEPVPDRLELGVAVVAAVFVARYLDDAGSAGANRPMTMASIPKPSPKRGRLACVGIRQFEEGVLVGLEGVQAVAQVNEAGSGQDACQQIEAVVTHRAEHGESWLPLSPAESSWADACWAAGRTGGGYPARICRLPTPDRWTPRHWPRSSGPGRRCLPGVASPGAGSVRICFPPRPACGR